MCAADVTVGRSVRSAVASLLSVAGAGVLTLLVAVAIRGPRGGVHSFVHHGAGGAVVAFGLAGFFVVTYAVLLRGLVTRATAIRVSWRACLGGVAIVCTVLIGVNRILGSQAEHDIPWLVISGLLLCLGPGVVGAALAQAADRRGRGSGA